MNTWIGLYRAHGWIFLCLLLAVSSTVYAQEKNDALTTRLHHFFEALNKKDTAALATMFFKNAELVTVHQTPSGELTKNRQKASDFLNALGGLVDTQIEEKIENLTVHLDENMANTWMDYVLFVNGRLSHCGVNNIVWAMDSGQWKILHLADTRRKKNCENVEKKKIHNLVDAWHHGAATANEDLFFGNMTDNAIYLGTDETERWIKSEFEIWSKKYFDRDTAWAFQPYDRTVYFSGDGKTAWWEELLKTWMGVCRGSGIAIKQNSEWKIAHYHLSVTIDNEKMDGFLELIKKD